MTLQSTYCHSFATEDVHVWRIVTRDYDPALREELVECVKLCWCRLAGVLLHERTLLAAVEAKSLTPSVYARVGDAFRRRFGSSAAVADLLLVD